MKETVWGGLWFFWHLFRGHNVNYAEDARSSKGHLIIRCSTCDRSVRWI